MTAPCFVKKVKYWTVSQWFRRGGKVGGTVMSLVALLLTVSCAFLNKGREAGESAVNHFHQQLNAEQYTEIYRQADERFRSAVKEAESTALFEAVHRKLGIVKNGTVTSWRVDSTPAGTFVSLVYNTTFTGGEGVEQFRFLISGEQASLVNYNINSPQLIIK